MKKTVLLITTTCVLFAGPDINMLIDYDAKDISDAKIEEKQQIVIPKPVIAPIVTAPVISVIPLRPVAKVSNGCYTNSVDFMGGWNFTKNNAHLDDSATGGIRVNKCITNSIFAQVGYDRVFDAEHRNKKTHYNTQSQLNSRVIIDDRVAVDKSLPHRYTKESTPLDRFYLNGLYEINNNNTFFPFVFVGVGYELGKSKDKHIKSQGFYNTGIGLKYKLSERLNLITKATAIKKFDNSDLDIVGALGIGVMLGTNKKENIQQKKTIVTPKPTITPSTPPIITPTTATPTINNSNLETSIKKGLIKTKSTMDIQPITEIAPDKKIQLITKIAPDKKIQPIINNPQYYIQIVALFTNNIYEDNSHYFDKLEANGLDYQIKQTTIKGDPVQLLLVGPYHSNEEAREDLDKAKEVEKGAFIKKVDP